MPFEIWNDHIEVGFVGEKYTQFKFDVFKDSIYKSIIIQKFKT